MTGPKICAKTLEGGGVRLEPLAREHFEGLRRAADAPEVWTHVPVSGAGDGFMTWYESAAAIAGVGKEVVWAVRTLDDGAIVGSTRYLNIDAANRRVEVGHTWYASKVWGSFVNPACKFLLLQYAFEDLRLHRVELKTDILNLRSQAAIAKLGAVREGVFRAHMIRRDGSLRDTVYFSIIRDEWPAVRERLEARLALTPAEA